MIWCLFWIVSDLKEVNLAVESGDGAELKVSSCFLSCLLFGIWVEMCKFLIFFLLMYVRIKICSSGAVLGVVGSLRK